MQQLFRTAGIVVSSIELVFGSLLLLFGFLAAMTNLKGGLFNSLDGRISVQIVVVAAFFSLQVLAAFVGNILAKTQPVIGGSLQVFAGPILIVLLLVIQNSYNGDSFLLTGGLLIFYLMGGILTLTKT